MHQSIPPVPSPPPPLWATAGHLPTLSVPGVGHLQILHCLGPFLSFWHARSFLSEYNYTQRVLLKKKQIGSSVKDRNKLKRVVKACSRLGAGGIDWRINCIFIFYSKFLVPGFSWLLKNIINIWGRVRITRKATEKWDNFTQEQLSEKWYSGTD